MYPGLSIEEIVGAFSPRAFRFFRPSVKPIFCAFREERPSTEIFLDSIDWYASNPNQVSSQLNPYNPAIYPAAILPISRADVKGRLSPLFFPCMSIVTQKSIIISKTPLTFMALNIFLSQI